MKRMALLTVLVALVAAGRGFADDKQTLAQVTLPDDKEAATKVLKQWLEDRHIDVVLRNDRLLLRRGGVLMHLIPIVTKGQLDRLRVIAFYNPKPEFKGSKELEQLTVKLNRSQNFLQVFVNDDGDLAVGGNLTFYDVLSARLFDTYVDAFAQVVTRLVLTEEAVNMLIPDTQSGVVKQKAQEFGQALIKGDFAKAVDLTYPKLVEERGGRDKLIASLEMSTKLLKNQGFVLQSAEADEPGEFLTEGENTFVIVPTTNAMRAPGGGTVGGKTYLLGISSDKGKTWRFMQGTELSNRGLRAKVLPKLPAKLKLPDLPTPKP